MKVKEKVAQKSVKKAKAEGKDKNHDLFVEDLKAAQLLDASNNSNPHINKLIDLKATKDHQNDNRKKMLYALSLCLSLILIITAFEWKTYTKTELVQLSDQAEKFEDLLEIPQTEQPPPPPPKIQQPKIVEVANEEIFTIVEQNPEPVGGMAAFYKFVGEKLQYPDHAERLNIEGRVFCQFVVEKDGRLTDIEVIKGIGGGCDEEAARVLSMAPNWLPGKQRGRPVRVSMVLPIYFKLVSG